MRPSRTRAKGKPVNARLFLEKLDAIRTRVRTDFGTKDAEIPATCDIIRELALLLRVAKAETMYKNVEDIGAMTEQHPVAKKGQARGDDEIAELYAGLGDEGKFVPGSGPEAAPLGRIKRVRRAPNLEQATANTVADRDALAELD